MPTKTIEKPNTKITLPPARLINASLWEKVAFTDENGNTGKPHYKAEIAVRRELVGPGSFVEDKMADAVEARWGAAAANDFLDGKPGFIDPRLDGDLLCAEREKRGKVGDAYKGLTVIRTNTTFNFDGADAPGGIQVFNEDVERLTVLQQAEVYLGCMVQLGVNIATYEQDNPGNKAVKWKGIKFYLEGVQKVGEGERLSTGVDKSSMFKPVGRQATAGTEPRRRRG